MELSNINATVSEAKVLGELLIEQRITNELLREIQEAEEGTKSIISELNTRQRSENKIGFWIATVMLLIAMFAFYVEIVKLDDLNIIKDRTEVFIDSINPWSDPNV